MTKLKWIRIDTSSSPPNKVTLQDITQHMLAMITGFLSLVGGLNGRSQGRVRRTLLRSPSQHVGAGKPGGPLRRPPIHQHNAGEGKSSKSSSEPPRSGSTLSKENQMPENRRQKMSRSTVGRSSHLATHASCRSCNTHKAWKRRRMTRSVHFCLQTRKALCLLPHWEGWGQTYYFSHKGLIIRSSNVDASSQCVGFFTCKFELKKKKMLSDEKCCQQGKAYGGYLNLVLKAFPLSSQRLHTHNWYWY